MSHAIRIHRPGGPEVLKWEEVEVGEPGPGEVRLRQEAAGLNFIDVYHRTGFYPQPLPFTPGVEGAGEVESVGPDVDNVQVGDRKDRTQQHLSGHALEHHRGGLLG